MILQATMIVVTARFSGWLGVASSHQLADILTKALVGADFKAHRGFLMNLHECVGIFSIFQDLLLLFLGWCCCFVVTVFVLGGMRGYTLSCQGVCQFK